MSSLIRLSLLLVPALALAACSASAPPPASVQADAAANQHTQLRDTIQKPINKAKGVEGTVEKSFENQNRQLDAAEGASASQASSPP